jgi:catechol 2,3-dioxygenase-like lactoylglutathione lyase family enzyme
MTRNRSFAHAQIHHIVLRVADAKASKDWFSTRLDFRVDVSSSFGGMDFAWLCQTGGTSVIELIDGGVRASRPPYEDGKPQAAAFSSYWPSG